MCGFSILTVGLTKAFPGPPHGGKVAIPTPDLVHSQCIAVSEGADVCHNICTVPILTLLVQAALFLGLSICGLGQWTPQVLLLRPSYGERKETKTLKMVFPHLTQYTVLFYSEPFSAFSPNSGSVKLSQRFFFGPLTKRLSPHLG